MDTLSITASAAIGAAGGVWFALFMLILLGSLIWSSEVESFFLGLGVLVIGLVVLNFLFGYGVFAAIYANPILLLVGLVVYTIVGTLYAAWWKMPNFLAKNKIKIKTQYDYWVREVTERGKVSADTSYEKFLSSSHYGYSVRDNKDRVASWVLLWPFGMVWELSHKPFIWLWNKAYFGIGRILENLNVKLASKILDERKNDQTK